MGPRTSLSRAVQLKEGSLAGSCQRSHGVLPLPQRLGLGNEERALCAGRGQLDQMEKATLLQDMDRGCLWLGGDR